MQQEPLPFSDQQDVSDTLLALKTWLRKQSQPQNQYQANLSTTLVRSLPSGSLPKGNIKPPF